MTFDADGAVSLILRGGGMGAGLGVTLAIMRMLFGRLDRREAHLDSATKELIEELRREIVRLCDRADAADRRADATDLKLRECEERDARRHAELMKVQRLLQANGEIRNRIQTGMAAEKLLGKPGRSEGE